MEDQVEFILILLLFINNCTLGHKECTLLKYKAIFIAIQKTTFGLFFFIIYDKIANIKTNEVKGNGIFW